jgi:hypothetical protein
MTDRELLELAAKAAGYKLGWHERRVGHRDEPLLLRGHGLLTQDGKDWLNYPHLWNPLDDDGDALRLAVKLRLQVTPGTYRDHEATAFRSGAGEAHEPVHYQQDIYAATRRAIVRAAAEIGKALKHP